MKRAIYVILSAFSAIFAWGADPTATTYTFQQCEGSYMPYPVPRQSVVAPDSLRAVFINHVGRHGARNPSSPNNSFTLRSALERADSLGTITPEGRRLLALTRMVIDRCHNYWGALDSLGEAEQRGIASRMFVSFPELFIDGKVTAISSYSPRCVMSMYEFTHQLDRLNNNVELWTSAGRQNSRLMRPFDIDQPFIDYLKGKVWETPLKDYMATQITDAPLKRVLGRDFPLTASATEKLAMAEYSFVASLAAMGLTVDASQFFTLAEYNALWSCSNLRHYLQRSASTLSMAPAEIASPLVLDLIRTTDEAVASQNTFSVNLRFGHAETLLPLFALLRLKGCYYLTNYFDSVGQHFRDFDIIPMAANLQMILFRADSGRYYVRFDLNEVPTTLIPNDERVYIPWADARAYMIRCLPLIDQP